MGGRKTQLEFLKESFDVHGNLYDYSKAIYVRTDLKVEIICKEHGSFWQRPNDHISDKNGCPTCGKERRGLLRRLIPSDFINRITEVHGNRYDYSKTVYVKSDLDVIITCKIHGDFKQKPFAHLNGCGCNKCGIELVTEKSKCTNEEFIKKAAQIHNKDFSKIDYSFCQYTMNKKPVKLRCIKHDLIFKQAPSTHLSGKGGCQECKKESTSSFLSKTQTGFLSDALKVHGDDYDYSLVKYRNSKEKIDIICKVHGVFKQKPNDHLSGHGCNKCGQAGSTYNITKAERNKKEWLDTDTAIYLIEFKSESENFIKIGISNDKDLRHRVLSRVSKCKIVSDNSYNIDLYNAVIIEQTLLKNYKLNKYIPHNKFCGYTECMNLNLKDQIISEIEYKIANIK